MNQLEPRKILFVSLAFLLTIYFTSGVDLGIAVSFIAFIVFFGFADIWLFIFAGVFLIVHLAAVFLNLTLGYVYDLSISSYFLLAAGVFCRLIRGKAKEGKIEISSGILLKTGGVFVFTALIYPLVGGYTASILGYIVFVSVHNKFGESRYAFGLALFFLILCPILLISGKGTAAENSAVFTYIFLVVGAIQGIADLGRRRKLVQPFQ